MKIKAVILDWAGTTIDFGCCGPVGVVRAAFKQYGIELGEADARRPMGLLKRDHIAAIFAYPSVIAEWSEVQGRTPVEFDIDLVYDTFVELQASSLNTFADVIPGVMQTIAHLRSRGIRIGSTTGYTRAMLAPVAESAAEQGYAPDFSVTPDEVGSGRPAPFMILENLVRLGVWPLASVIKVGDTPADIEEGISAGVWSVGIAGTGNGIGMTASDFDKLSEQARQSKLDASRKELRQAGAHFVIDSMTELVDVINQIEAAQAPLPEPSVLRHPGVQNH